MAAKRGAFLTHGERFLDMGLVPLPVRPGTQFGPRKWSTLSEDAIRHAIHRSRYAQWGIALRLDYLAAIDIDTNDPNVKRAVWQVLKDHGLTCDTMIGRIGSKGAAIVLRDPERGVEPIVLRRDGEPDIDYPAGETETFFEVRAGSKHMLVVPPTIHPKTGHPYTWVSLSLLDVNSIDDLSICTSALVNDLQRALVPWTRQESERPALPPAHNVVRPHELDDDLRRRIERYARAILARCGNELAGHKGGRRCKAFRIGCRLGQYVHHGILTTEDIEHALAPAWVACEAAKKHGADEIKTHLRNGIKKAANDVLHVPHDRPLAGRRGCS